MDKETHQQVLDLTKELVAEFQEATQIVGFFEKDDEMRTIKRLSKCERLELDLAIIHSTGQISGVSESLRGIRR